AKNSVLDFFFALDILNSGIVTTLIGFGELVWALVNFDAEAILDSFSTLGEGFEEMSLGLYIMSMTIGEAMINGILFVWDIKGGLIYSMMAWVLESAWNDLIVEVASWAGIELPEIKMPTWKEMNDSVTKPWNDLKTYFEENWNGREFILDRFDFSGLIPEMPDLKTPFDEWWNGFKDWLDENINPLSLLEEKFDFELNELIPDFVKPWLPGYEEKTGDNVNQQPSKQENVNKNNDSSIAVESIMGGNQPVNRTTNESSRNKTEQKNDIQIMIDNAGGDNADLERRLRKAMSEIFTEIQISETGGY
ncbi:MAG: hypothetical protein ACOCQD_05065, partial [archaeon]